MRSQKKFTCPFISLYLTHHLVNEASQIIYGGPKSPVLKDAEPLKQLSCIIGALYREAKSSCDANFSCIDKHANEQEIS